MLLLILLGLLFRTETAYAEWFEVDSARSDLKAYFNPDTIRRNENRAKVSILYDYLEPQRNYLSTTIEQEFDCMKPRFRILAFIDFTDSMASGKIVDSVAVPGSWNSVAPESVDEALWVIVCGK